MLHKFVRFYHGPGMHYAVSDSGTVFSVDTKSIGIIGTEDKNPILPDWESLTLAEWTALHFPISFEAHWADEPPEEPAEAPPRELTNEEAVHDAKYKQDLRWWKRERTVRLAKALDAAAHIDPPFVTSETTTVTMEYSSPLVNKVLAAFLDGDEGPEDPIAWRREADAASKVDMMKTIVDAANSFVAAYMAKASEKPAKKPPEEKKA